MKKIISIGLIVFIFVCSFIVIRYNNPKIRAVKNFLDTFYTVSDISNFDLRKYQICYPKNKFDNRLRELTTEDAFNELICDRLSLLNVMAGYNIKFNTSIKNLSIKKCSEEDNGTVYDYSLDLYLKYVDEKKTVKENIRGQLTVSKIEVNGSKKWLISKINKLPIPKSFSSKNK
ncbi:hypothetical protein CLTEP_06660 [Clostridium tepidiprofundi DSM 19306]|uniref:Uncharacterized protein n=1 Tax=Clostridium tepidiprofundi DSM 19306 TaxID=1121338 RepID=A0A151B6T1_9CLOT|nr:hypothetical protein [Clostridium tepidiprofundi]KYH35490.1 hypothetical protein CLTEP_06660 [Clostridium tepidiprofundi DSM 19306]